MTTRLIGALAFLIAGAYCLADWQPAKGPLSTRWTKNVSPQNALPEYPRPQMVRKQWMNLNGLWSFAITSKDALEPSSYAEQILVPYPVESALSGVMKRPDENSLLWYQRTVNLPAGWQGQRLLLHFGASDWKTTVWVNGQKVGEHTGGYDPFAFEITDAVKGSKQAKITVSVWDPTDAHWQPRGKQVKHPGGIMYTPTSGIWQTVWLEPVPQSHLESFRLTPNVDKGVLNIVPRVSSAPGAAFVEAAVLNKGQTVSTAEISLSKGGSVPVPNAILWTPEKPFLYGLRLTLKTKAGKILDRVDSYFAMRKVSLGPDAEGRTRICLNGKPLFMAGPLDQGFWPDGLYTPPTDAAMVYDIEMTKKLGFNMARKHVKVEPARWYYHCDRLGLLVWQDMPSGDSGRNSDSSANFGKELKAMVESLYNTPSIVMWIVYNEGWGQHETPKFVRLVKSLDATRLVSNASGWTDAGVGDIIDWHVYPGPGSPDPEPLRAAVLGEFGGLGLPIKGHMWQDAGNWGYVSMADQSKLTEGIVGLYRGVHLLIGSKGLSGCVYTQTSDVEIESNGLMSYDREVLKVDLKKHREAVMKLYGPVPKASAVVPTAQAAPVTWRYSFAQPSGNWTGAAYDDSAWQSGPAGFGTRMTPGSVVRTEWTGSDIWLRRKVTTLKAMKRPHLMIHHDEDAEVYIDGVKVAELTGFTTSYTMVPIKVALKAGEHLIAVHCRQTTGGQYIDLGLVDLSN